MLLFIILCIGIIKKILIKKYENVLKSLLNIATLAIK